MIHLGLYQLTSGATAAAVLKDMPAVTGDVMPILNNHFVPDRPSSVLAAYGFGQTDLTDMQLQTPKLRSIAIPHLNPLDIVTAPSNRTPMINMRKHPLSLTPGEEVSVQMSAGTFTSGNSYYAALWFTDGIMAAPTGDIFTAQFTASVATAAGQWSSAPITLQNPLPAGRYAVVGMSCYGANLAFARLVLPNQVWRPGCIAGLVAGFIPPPCFRFGEFGVWGEFVQTAQPSLEVFGTGTTSTQTGFLDLYKIG